MRIVIILSIMFFFISCRQAEENTKALSYSKDLVYGPYDIGFRTMFTRDLSREAVPYSDWSGRLYPADEEYEGRNLPISIWYPAVKTKTPLKFDHFLKLITRQSERSLNGSIDSLAERIFINQTNELGGDGNFTAEQLKKLLGLQTNSFLNSKAIEDKFPLVIFPNGTSPAYQNIMCELLASHGYVVAGLPLKGQYTQTVDASVRGLEVAVDDLEFALQQLLTLNNVDGDLIALMGNAIEASFCAGLASRNKKIKALISLEGGFLSTFEQGILNKTNFYEPQNLTIPILAIYAPHPAISPDYIFHLNYSERYFAHFPNMSEFHFLNYGVFEDFIPGIIGETNGNTKEGFQAAADLSISFLNAKLKNKYQDLNLIYSEKKPGIDKRIVDTLFRLEGFDVPPNIAVLKNLFITKGMNSIDSIYQTHKAQGNQTPFSLNFYNDFKAWLAWKKDPDFIHRKHLYEMAEESFPNSALVNYYLASYLTQTENKTAAKKYYIKSLKLLGSDDNISGDQKNKLRQAIELTLNPE